METTILDALDYKILNLITNNARISFLEVARICDVSGAAVHQRVQKMTNNGVIIGSEFTLDLKKVGLETCAFVSIAFDHNTDLDKVVKKLEDISEITECHHTTGSYDLLLKIYAKNNSHLHEIILKKIKPLGITRSESVISYRASFRRQVSKLGKSTQEEL